MSEAASGRTGPSGRENPFEDHFSGHARNYATYRPEYPEELFDWLAARCPRRDRAWDCACGNGQATRSLARRFARVVGTDGSLSQLFAARTSGWSAVAAIAEAAPLAAASCDLLTVAQALHWIEAPRLWSEARRVLRPGGVVAVWGYQLLVTSPPIDAILGEFYERTVGPYWPANRRLLEAGFAGIDFPFAAEDLEPPDFAMTARWNLAQLLGYIGTWSASARYRQALGRDPLDALRPALRAAWGDETAARVIRWPLTLRVGRVDARPGGHPPDRRTHPEG